MRITFCFLLLIISQFSYSEVTTSTETIAATPVLVSKSTVPANSVQSYYFGVNSSGVNSDKSIACQNLLAYIQASNSRWVSATYSPSTNICMATNDVGITSNYYSTTVNSYSCISPSYRSTSTGNPSSTGTYCTTDPYTSYTCLSDYTLSGTNCIKDVSTDSCTDYQGQSGYFWVSYKQAPATVCSGTCLANVGTHGDAPDYPYNRYVSVEYTYTGETSNCTADTGFVDDSTAISANADADEKDRIDRVNKAIADAKIACGGEGHYTTGTFNGATIVTCKDTGVQTTTNGDVTTTTVTNADGSTTTTTTTTTNNTSTTNNNSSTTINSDGSTSSSGGASGSTSGTTTSVVTRDPNGNVIASSTSGSSTTSGGVGTCDQDGMADKIACSEFGEIPADGIIPSETIDLSNLAVGASWWSNNAACIADVQIAPSIIFSYQPLCNLLSFMRPIIIGVAFIIAAFITLGFNKKEGD